MKIQYGKVLLPSLALAAILVGCGGANDKQMAESQKRIQVLQDKGAPDSVLSNAKVFLYNVNGAKKIGNHGEAKKNTDSMMIAIQSAEKWYEAAMASNKSYLESKNSELKTRKAALTGLQLKSADSMFSLIDSFTTIGWLIQARIKSEKLDSMMTDLEASEKRAKEVLQKIAGKWTDAHVVQEEGSTFKALDKRVYKFTPDLKFEGSEEMKGQTTEWMKEDWQFLSWGSYDVKGDTILLRINREKCVKQVFTQWHIKEKKWIESVKPTYDSTITNGSKDRFMTFADLKESFKK